MLRMGPIGTYVYPITRRVIYWNASESRVELRLLARVVSTFKMKNHGQSSGRPTSNAASAKVAGGEEVNYALTQEMGEGFQRSTIEISALGTTFNMVYGEWKGKSRSGNECPVVVCVHGTPATEGAFRAIGNLIAAKGYRVLAVNFPGNGYTKVDLDGRYDFCNSHKVQLVKAFIFALHLKSVAMVVGHSSGSHVVGGLAADPELEGIVQSVCLLCGTGIKPYRTQKMTTVVPYLPYLVVRAMHIPILGWLLTYLLSKLVYKLGFRGRTPESQVLSIYEAYQLNFDAFAQHLSRIAERELPVLLLYSLDDTVIKPELIPAAIATLGIPEEDIKYYDKAGHSEEQDLGPSTGVSLRRVVCFASGGHRLQFKRPEDTTKEMVSLLEDMRRDVDIPSGVEGNDI